ncbi:glycosyltransferase [Pontibacter sp. KCTC 32443]|uniref:glycosyltransferase n=1 Tax=Pontibacter TaxID=323449 RepID=UPI00164D84F3|nr:MULTISPECIES: glycosyltransferase [Pontibacter]MBC5773492.1 glycosyltransferase [Pontibacter sp. KCTC 32443]
MLPLVSIGIPNYNGSNYIVQTLESVKAQTYKNIEVFVVDDASTDDSVKVVNEWIRNNTELNVTFLIHDNNKGPCEACNTFFNLCNGEFFQYVGSDDILNPDKISKQVDILTNLGREYALVYSDTNLIDADGVLLNTSYLESLKYNKWLMPQGSILEELLLFNFIQSCSPLVRTEAAKTVGGFNTYFWVEDYDLWLRLSNKYKVAYIPKTTASYRKHLNSLTSRKSTWAKTIDEALHMRLQYFDKVSPEFQQKLIKVLRHDAAALYALDYTTAGYWLKRSFRISPTIKGAALLGLFKLGFSFSQVSNFKNKIKTFYKLF